MSQSYQHRNLNTAIRVTSLLSLLISVFLLPNTAFANSVARAVIGITKYESVSVTPNQLVTVLADESTSTPSTSLLCLDTDNDQTPYSIAGASQQGILTGSTYGATVSFIATLDASRQSHFSCGERPIEAIRIQLDTPGYALAPTDAYFGTLQIAVVPE